MAILVNSKPQVSVIIPAFNQAKYLKVAIDSALAQSYRDFEIIVVDDGSTDETKEFANAYGDQVRYIWQENKGLGGARNTGILLARGEYIAFLDSDDSWQSSFLEIMMARMQKSPMPAGLFCLAQGMDANGSALPQIFGGPTVPPPDIYGALIRANFIIPSTMVIRRSVIIAHGMFEQENKRIHGCEDWDLWLRILRNSKNLFFIGMPRALVNYRIHGNSLSDHVEGMQKAVRAVIEKNFGPELEPISSWTDNKRKAYAGVYRYNLLSSVQRKNNWDQAEINLRKSLELDPSICLDLSLFYDLAFGNQPPGFRGSPSHLALEKNALRIEEILTRIFGNSENLSLIKNKHIVFGNAYKAIGLSAYNVNQYPLARKYLIKSIFINPGFLKDSLILGNIVKTLLGYPLIKKIKAFNSPRIV